MQAQTYCQAVLDWGLPWRSKTQLAFFGHEPTHELSAQIQRKRKILDCSHLVQKALEHAGSFHRQRPWDANGLLKNNLTKKTRTATTEEREREGRLETMKGTILSRESMIQSTLSIGDHACCVGVRERKEMQRTLFFFPSLFIAY